ncbi:hypothetical protein CYLTODRAFT_132276 [Cylindrobasidium torrendii FP15055 ss-10]|uniref:F-box/LRR-repeat protein 15/At3g58940/PEG3-like LRR domain-containing protein n=1 Tax=Cylindrobasidium torrendii FP15055 ss-10 TaxID=1314674 RepID=A0A0D7AZA7_9AGAR|nr:hypothetical protein CYLTODRAFT_132276 [Cylindrobasidium torrendii FP15055 ss-10]
MQFTTPFAEQQLIHLLSRLPKLVHLSLNLPMDLNTPVPIALTHSFGNLRELTFSGGTSMNVDALKFIVANCPRLECLTLDGSNISMDGVTYLSLTALFSAIPMGVILPLRTLNLGGITIDQPFEGLYPHLQSLTTVKIAPQFLDVPASFWHALTHSNVHLRHLTAHQADPPLLQYLHSYSGLVTLSLDLCGFRAGDRRDSDEMADIVYSSVIPLHAESLENLQIKTAYEGHWTLGHQQLDLIMRCSKLSALFVGVGLSDLEVHADRNVITKLLDTLATLQAVRLFVAYPTSARGLGDSVLLMHSPHGVRGNTLLTQLVRSYVCDAPSPALLNLELSTGHIHQGHASLNTFKLVWGAQARKFHFARLRAMDGPKRPRDPVAIWQGWWI